MEESAIRLVNCNKKYKNKDKIVIALNNFSYKFEYGKLYAIMGHSGSGKSTLINCISMLDHVDSGNILINEKNIKKLNEKTKAKIRAFDIGLVFQDYMLNENMKVYENVILPMFLNKKIEAKDRNDLAYKLLNKVGVDSKFNNYPKHLSGGEQQRVAIARCLANNPNIILADEPTGNLDETNEKYIFKLLKDLSKEGKCVIVVSHDKSIKKYADERVYLEEGNIQ